MQMIPRVTSHFFLLSAGSKRFMFFKAFTTNIKCCRYAALLLSAFLFQPVFAEDSHADKQSVSDLRYGVALYEFYQQRFLPALTELAVVKQRGDLRGDEVHAELLTGGLSLSYGMDKKATAIFSRLLENNVEQSIRDQAWFYSGKMLHGRHDELKAKKYLAQVGDSLPEHLQDDYRYLQVLLNGDDAARMKSWIALLDDQLLRSYALFNLAMLQRQSGIADEAVLSLTQAASLKAEDEEGKALLDRIHLALAYIHLAEKQYVMATANFQKIRLDGVWSEQALLGYGWVAFNQDNYPLALEAWHTLSEKSVLGPVVQEAFIAIPHVYEKMGDKRKALDEFEKAVVHYEQLLSDLGGLIADFEKQDMTDYWLVNSYGDGWLSRSGALAIDPKTPWLAHMLALNSFQSSLRDLRDLQILKQNLQQWQEKMLDYRFMLETRQEAHSQRVAEMAQSEAGIPYERMLAVRNQLAEKVLEAERQWDVLAFNDAKQHKLQGLIASVKQTLSEMENSEEKTAYQQRLQRLEGLLYWQSAQQFPARLWEVKKHLYALDTQLATNQQLQQSISGLTAGSAANHLYGQRIDALEQRLKEQLVEVDLAINRANSEMREQVAAELTLQQKNIRHYLAQARLAIARLYDDYLQHSGGG